MSRIGNKEIKLPKGVTVSLSNNVITVKGPRGTLTENLVANTNLEITAEAVNVVRTDANSRLREGKFRAFHGLMRALLSNMVTGVSTGFSKTLELHGIGYKVNIGKDALTLHLGYSNPIQYAVPQTVKVEEVPKAKVPTIIVSGNSKQEVGQVASEIRGFRTPDNYKGKGVRYIDEVVRIKSGKSK